MSDELGALTERLRQLGAPDPEAWASSELNEDIPQTATFVALRNLWPTLIHPWRDPEVLARVPAARALLDIGVTPEAVSKAMCTAAFDAVIGTLWELTGSDEALDGAPGVKLMEVDPTGNLTGREIRGLHESLLSMDPTGQEVPTFSDPVDRDRSLRAERMEFESFLANEAERMPAGYRPEYGRGDL